MKSFTSIFGLLLLSAASPSAAIVYLGGGIATAEFSVTEPALQSFTIADLDDWADGGDFALNAGSVPEFRIEFESESERVRMANTNFAPIAVSAELGGEGLRQFALNEEINAAVAWGGQGRLETPTETTIWNSSSQGYAAFRVDRGSSNFNYGWVLLDYRDGSNQIELVAMAIETEINTSIQAGAVPEPSAIMLLASLGALLLVHRRQRA